MDKFRKAKRWVVQTEDVWQGFYLFLCDWIPKKDGSSMLLDMLGRDWRLYTSNLSTKLYQIRYLMKNKIWICIELLLKHDLCGMLNLSNICIRTNESCKDNHPKNFTTNIIVGKYCFLQYRCPNNRVTTSKDFNFVPYQQVRLIFIVPAYRSILNT